jgi:hypothetical protein
MAKRKPRTLSQIAALVEEANTEGTHNAMIWVSPNLFLQVRENSKTWQMRWTVGDRIHSMGLGRAFDPVALDEARRLVGRYMEVVRAGGDPREARDRERLEAGLKPVARRGPDAAQPVSINSFRDVTRAFLADRASSWKSDATEMHFANRCATTPTRPWATPRSTRSPSSTWSRCCDRCGATTGPPPSSSGAHRPGGGLGGGHGLAVGRQPGALESNHRAPG